MKSIRNLSLLLCLFMVVTACKTWQTSTAKSPNVIVFLVDDMGWKDLGCYGSTFYQTPTIDSIAAQGVRFTDAYSACTVCSPTRAALMTGKYPARLHVTDWIPGHVRPWEKMKVPDWTMYLDHEEETLAELLKTKGYTTASIGKWHLGEDSIYWPESHGFDVNIGGYSKGGPRGHYFSPYHNPRLPDGPKGEYLTERLTDEAVTFIEEQTDQPFFLYMTHYAVHNKLEAPKEVIDKYKALQQKDNPQKNPIYAAMVESVDDSMRDIIEALKRTGELDNTIIFFTSDNGSLLKVSPSNPLRDGKGSIYEGAVRVPMIVYAPGIIEGGEIEDTPVITMDIFSSVTDFLDIETPKNIDGESLWPLLMNEKWNRKALYWHYPHYHTCGAIPYSAIRKGKWKLIEIFQKNTFELYNLEDDIGEVNNVATQYPEVLEELKQDLEQWRMSVEAQYPTVNASFDPERRKKN